MKSYRRRLIIDNADPHLLLALMLRLTPLHRVEGPDGIDMFIRGAKWAVPSTIDEEVLAILREDDTRINEFICSRDWSVSWSPDEENELDLLHEKTNILAMADTSCSYGCDFDKQITVVEYKAGHAILDFQSGMFTENYAVEECYNFFSKLCQVLGRSAAVCTVMHEQVIHFDGEDVGPTHPKRRDAVDYWLRHVKLVEITLFGEQKSVIFKFTCDDCRQAGGIDFVWGDNFDRNPIRTYVWETPSFNTQSEEFVFDFADCKLSCREDFCHTAAAENKEELDIMEMNDFSCECLDGSGPLKFSKPIFRKNDCYCLGDWSSWYIDSDFENVGEVKIASSRKLSFHTYVLLPLCLYWPQDLLDFLFPAETAHAFNTMLALRHAARVIQRCWRRCICDPSFVIGHKRVESMFQEMLE